MLMRLVDLDDAVKALEQAYPNDGQMSCHDAIAVIETVPTIEPRKGKWIPKFEGKFKGGGYWFDCSICGRTVPEVRNGGWNFCPRCGADMRGE
jgi:hypothetical protein